MLRAGGGTAKLTTKRSRGCRRRRASAPPQARRWARPGTGGPAARPAPGRCPHLSAHVAPPTPRCSAAPQPRARLGPTGGSSGGASLRPPPAGPAQLTRSRRARLRGGGDATGASGRAGGEGVAQQQLLARTGREGRQTAAESARLARRLPGPAGRGSHPGTGQPSPAAAASLVPAGGRAHRRLPGRPCCRRGRGQRPRQPAPCRGQRVARPLVS